MTILAVMVAEAVAALSLSQVREMPPSAAGNIVLGDLPHGQIESFKSPTGGMLPPNMIEGQFMERPELIGSTCVRRIWTISFRASPGSDIGTAISEDKRDNQEIAIPTGRSCPSGQYAYLNPGISVEQGAIALAKLEGVKAKRSRTHFICSDRTSSGLCAGNVAIRASLRTIKPWLVKNAGSQVLLGIPGGVVTQVSFEPGGTTQAHIDRFVPAPF